MRKATVIKTGIGFICGAILLVSVHHFVKPPDHFETTVPAWRLNLGGIHSALCRYKQKLGKYPEGGPERIAAELSGDNTLKQSFLPERFYDENNRLIDPWRTPVQIEYSQDGTCIVRSAGKNKRWGDSDDHAYSLPIEQQTISYPPQSLNSESHY